MHRRFVAVGLGVLLSAAAARAHFVFLVPTSGTEGQAVFSDALKADKAGVSVERIAGTKLVQIKDGKPADLTWTLDKKLNAYTFTAPGDDTRTVVGITDYGVFQRGDRKPMWLRYYPKAVFGAVTADDRVTAAKAVPFELIPVVDGKALRFKAVGDGKPMGKVEVSVLIPGEDKAKVVVTDARGLTDGFEKIGQYGAYARRVEAKAGEKDGKKYEEVAEYATLVVTHGR